jgi:hypothetical protein
MGRTGSGLGAAHETVSGKVVPGVVQLILKLEKMAMPNPKPMANQKNNEHSN